MRHHELRRPQRQSGSHPAGQAAGNEALDDAAKQGAPPVGSSLVPVGRGAAAHRLW